MYLIKLVNQLQEAAARTGDAAELARSLRKMVAYAQVHFDAESKLARTHSYPSGPSHEKEHEIMVKQLADLLARCEAGRGEVAGEAAALTGDWLRRHIMGTDRLLGKYLVERGAR